MRKYPTITNIIKGAMARSGYTAKDLAAATGIPYSTLMRQRFIDPGGWRLYELGAVMRTIHLEANEITKITEEIRK